MASKQHKQKISLSNIKRLLKGAVPDGGMAGKTVELAMSGGSASPTQVCVPDGTDNYSGTIRSHESRHLSYSPCKTGVLVVPPAWVRHPLMHRCVQFAEDCYVETRPLPESTPKSYREMHRDAARQDLVSLSQMDDADKETFAAKVLISARAKAMFHNYGATSADNREMEKTLPQHLQRSLNMAVNYAMQGNRAKSALTLFKILGGNMEEIGECATDEEIKEGTRIELAEGSLKSVISTIEGKRSVMKIIELPRTVPTKPQTEPVFRTCYPDSGSRINTSRLVNAVVSGDARGVFIQCLTEPRGESVLLIDASSSMGINEAMLSRLCRASPNATVAYYCGTDCDAKPEGWLFVYAKGGKRYDGKVERPKGGNSVDLPAMEWAMRQHGPITLVSDLGFCGCSQGEIAEAHGLVERLKGDGRLTVIGDVGIAIRQAERKGKED